ncbi:Transcription initiation factor IIB [Candidatus Lokiarchaeum ossiferum]|uniref:Transcription initiation factor IIB n=1 Tax=Candidatus Lokiarchaeum ossiferum TaxID=2951803 RepID=A0ABY6HRP3_9ARCH|nr:Transcription initiation factor IIB [Candidatus Lokiarchaeum sp. B-35]
MAIPRFYEKDYEDEQCCPTPEILVNNEGMRVCTNCGLVLGRAYVSAEKRAYTADEVKNRRRTEPRWRNYGPRTVIGVNSSDSKGQALVGKQKSMFNRLSKIQGSLVNSLERNFWEARPKINQLAKKLNIPDHILETAWKIYSEVAKQKLTMGRSIDSFVAASTYAAIRIHNFPRLLEEIVDVAMLPLRGVHRSLGLVVRNVLPVLNMKYRPVSPEPLVFRFGNDLNISVSIQKKASDLLRLALKHGLQKMGKDPKGLAAAALYLAAKPTVERKTQTEIADTARITEVTLRTRAKQIKSSL